MITVLLADDHGIVRTILRQVLERAGDMQVVSVASNGRDAVNEAVIHCPNVAVIDLAMPVMNGLEATRQICSQCPKTRVLIATQYNFPIYIQRSIEAGAFGYILKDVVSRDFVMAVRAIHQGNRYFSQQIANIAKLHIKL